MGEPNPKNRWLRRRWRDVCVVGGKFFEKFGEVEAERWTNLA
jgi:hypothetical protein